MYAQFIVHPRSSTLRSLLSVPSIKRPGPSQKKLIILFYFRVARANFLSVLNYLSGLDIWKTTGTIFFSNCKIAALRIWLFAKFLQNSQISRVLLYIKMFLKPVCEGKMHGVTKIGIFRPLFCVNMLGKSTNYSTGTRRLCSTF